MPRAIGYAVPMLICAVLGAVLFVVVPSRSRRSRPALTPAERSTWRYVEATVGAVLGAGVGWYVARESERR